MNIIDPDIDFESEYLRAVGGLEAQSIRAPLDFMQQISDRRNETGSAQGEFLPWTNAEFFRFRPGEVTGWVGYNYHGKSRIAGQACAWLMRTSRHLVASMEMPAAATIDRMIAQCAGREEYSDTYQTNWLHWAQDRLWLYDVQERVSAEKLLGLCVYASQELKCQHVWIDSLMQTKLSGDARNKYGEQADFVDDLCRIAKAFGIHVHLVMHLRKPEHSGGEEKIPDRYSVSGAAELTNRPDNVIIIHRNVRKERELEKQDPEEGADMWRDGTLAIDKQRHHRGKNGTGRIRMWESGGGAWTDERGRRIVFPVDVMRVRIEASIQKYHERQSNAY